MGSQELKEFSCSIVFREKQMTIFKKKKKIQDTLLLGPFCPNFEQIWIFHTNQALSLFSIHYSPLTSCKKSEKTTEPILTNGLN